MQSTHILEACRIKAGLSGEAKYIKRPQSKINQLNQINSATKWRKQMFLQSSKHPLNKA